MAAAYASLPPGLAQLIAPIPPDDNDVAVAQALYSLGEGAGLDIDDPVTIGAVILGILYNIELAERSHAVGALTFAEASAVKGVCWEAAKVWRAVLDSVQERVSGRN